MLYKEEFFRNKSFDSSKLRAYGFVPAGNDFQFLTTLQGGRFNLLVYIRANGEIEVSVKDAKTKVEYSLVHDENASGKFVGQVRAELKNRMKDICEKCFFTEIFKNENAKKILTYIKNEYGQEPEFLWEKYPNYAVFREPKNNKWYGLLMSVARRKLGEQADGWVEVMVLRVGTAELEKLLDGKNILPAYHMNKKHWFTVRLDGGVSWAKIQSYLVASRQSVQ